MPYINQIYYNQYTGAAYPKTPIILLHGIGGSHLSWPAKMRRINGYNVYALDLPGHGKSKGVAAQDIQLYVPMMVDFLAGLGAFKALFVGQDMGAAIALKIALEEPDHVAGLGIISGAASYQIGTGYLQDFRSEVTLPTALRKLEGDMRYSGVSAGTALKTQPQLNARQSSIWYTDLRACARFDVRRALARIKQPTFIAAGRLDRMVPFSNSAFLANQIPHAVFKEYGQNGHALLQEEQEQISADFKAFLNTHYI